jgi:hypothetical protein
VYRTTEDRLRVGFMLDSRWFGMKFNQGDRSKEQTLHQLIDALIDEQVPYAIIGGVALQVHTSDPRTTVDIDVAVPERADIPVAALEARGFKHAGSFDFTENWKSPDDIAVQFSTGRDWPGVVARAEVHVAFGKPIRFLTALDLVRAKLAAATEPGRRKSKVHHDVGDIETLVEEHPELLDQLSEDERSLVDRLTRRPE